MMDVECSGFTWEQLDTEIFDTMVAPAVVCVSVTLLELLGSTCFTGNPGEVVSFCERDPL